MSYRDRLATVVVCVIVSTSLSLSVGIPNPLYRKILTCLQAGQFQACTSSVRITFAPFRCVRKCQNLCFAGWLCQVMVVTFRGFPTVSTYTV